MELSVFYVVFVGFLLENTDAGGKKDHVHIKIHVPEYIKHHHHTKYVYIKKGGGGHKKGHDHGHDDHGHDDHKHKEKKKVSYVIHKHEHNHKHKHDHGHKHGHNHGHKHEAKHDHKVSHKGNLGHKHEVKKVQGHGKGHGHHHDDHGHTSYDHEQTSYDHGHQDHEGYSDYDDHDGYSLKPYNGNYERRLTGLRSEKLQYETVENPRGLRPGRYLVKASYKVNEKDPYDYTTRGYHQNFQYPAKDGSASLQDVYKYAQLVKQFKSNDEPFAPIIGTTSAPSYDDIKQLESEQDYRDDKLQAEYDRIQNNKNYVDYDYNPPVESFENSNYEYGDSTEGAQTRHNYRIDGTSLDDYLKNEYGNKHEASEVSELKVPFNSTSTAVPDSSQLA